MSKANSQPEVTTELNMDINTYIAISGIKLAYL